MRINVGLVGYGLSGAVFNAPLIAAVPDLRLTAVLSSRPEAVHRDLPEAQVVSTIDHLLADESIGLVVLASPNDTHYDYARRALEAGKHVVVEKPFTVTSAEADALITLARQQNLLLTVFQNRRWDSDFLTIQHLLETGMLGDVITYEAHFDRYRPEVRHRWREQAVPGGGILYDLGSHLIDQALLLFGLPESVGAVLQIQRPGGVVEDYFSLTLGYGRRQVVLRAGSIVREPGPRFQVHGTKGSFSKYGLDSQEEMLRAGGRPGSPQWGQDPESQHGQLTAEVGALTIRGRVATLPGRYEAFYEGVARAILDGAPAPVDPVMARSTIRVIELAIQSHQKQRFLPFGGRP